MVVVVVVVTVDGLIVRTSLRDLLPLAASRHAGRLVRAFEVSRLNILMSVWYHFEVYFVVLLPPSHAHRYLPCNL